MHIKLKLAAFLAAAAFLVTAMFAFTASAADLPQTRQFDCNFTPVTALDHKFYDENCSPKDCSTLTFPGLTYLPFLGSKYKTRADWQAAHDAWVAAQCHTSLGNPPPSLVSNSGAPPSQPPSTPPSTPPGNPCPPPHNPCAPPPPPPPPPPVHCNPPPPPPQQNCDEPCHHQGDDGGGRPPHQGSN